MRTINQIDNVMIDGKSGVARIFDTETEAHEYQQTVGGKIILYGGFYNAVWYPDKKEMSGCQYW